MQTMNIGCAAILAVVALLIVLGILLTIDEKLPKPPRAPYRNTSVVEDPNRRGKVVADTIERTDAGSTFVAATYTNDTETTFDNVVLRCEVLNTAGNFVGDGVRTIVSRNFPNMPSAIESGGTLQAAVPIAKVRGDAASARCQVEFARVK